MNDRWQEIIGTILFVALMVFVFAIQRNPYEEPEEVKPGYVSGMPCEDQEAYRIWEEWYEQATKEKIEESGRSGDVERTSTRGSTADYTVNYRSRTIVKGSIAESSSDFAGADTGGDTGVAEGEINEQAASEETDVCDEISVPESHRRMDVPQTTCPETVEGPCELAVEESVLVLSETTPEPIPEMTPQDKLLTALRDANIEWWYPYGWAQCQQESHWNQWAENPNGLDKGLFQYRITYWTEPESIFDVNAQIRRYVQEVSARIAAGLSIEEVISRHFTSDYVTEINWQYVNDVLQHLN